MSNPFGEDALAKATRNVPLERQPEGASVTAGSNNGDVGVEGSVTKDLGKDMFIQGEGSWFRRAGYRWAARFGWTPKK